MTVETVAEHTRRPLYAIASGELGTLASELETALREALDIFKTFRAVLPLDEADVFLEKRRPHDVGRNALVSIFLRLLEYYQGVLFLTTNRVEEFDDAFHSRIHIALRFAPRTKERRKEVWKNFCAFADAGTHLSEDNYNELAEKQLNGREIKNILSCSNFLASGRGERNYLGNIKEVLGIAVDFGERN
ncbi:unnamed protein product [Clonostachys rosea]|uniref:ATPase AAA-type core domain-containing protein n=1 Tax=Bionectria ochroleuca TaxID=29856 RepID=A0ABY6UW72_BIOOC|nr:unnamed protein product [Clonostachys rosea]